jgi:hypothetical protein
LNGLQIVSPHGDVIVSPKLVLGGNIAALAREASGEMVWKLIEPFRKPPKTALVAKQKLCSVNSLQERLMCGRKILAEPKAVLSTRRAAPRQRVK